MLLDFSLLIQKYNLQIHGIVHIGAHIGEEHIFYIEHKIPKVIYFEPIAWCYNQLHSRVQQLNIQIPNKIETTIYPIALGNKNQEIEMNVSEHKTIDYVFGASSSFLKPKKHLEIHPEVIFTHTIKATMCKLDDIHIDQDYNFINIDTQGYELEVFKGGQRTLHQIDYIMTEVNVDEVYENCAKMEELDDFLSSYGFIRKETCLGGGLWGDAFYIKENK